MTTQVTPIQILRSEVVNKRPDPALMLPGQPAVNTNSTQPGLFFADNTGSSLFKVGPCSVGGTAPNDGATGAVGSLGNTVGELWLDTTSTAESPGPTLRVWDGTQWIDCMPYRYATAIISPSAPTESLYSDGTMWWNPGTSLLYVLYDDGVTRTWVEVLSNPVP